MKYVSIYTAYYILKLISLTNLPHEEKYNKNTTKCQTVYK